MKKQTLTPLDVIIMSKSLGISLKTARKRRGFTQEDVASRIGVAREVVLNAEKGKATSSYNLMSMLWLYGLLGQMIDAVSHDRDTVGISLDRSRLPKRVRKKACDDEF